MSIFNIWRNYRAAQNLAKLQTDAKNYDDRLDDPHGDGTGTESRPPEGEDYNRLYQMLMSTSQR